MTATAPSTYVSGFCGADRHEHCHGTYAGVTCTCPHHTEPPAPRHVVMFSSGAGSWAAARRVADQYGTDGLVLLFADVKGSSNDPHIGEDGDNYRFLREAAADIGGELVVVSDGRTIWEVFRDKRFLGNARLANCSALLKQEPSRAWLAEHADPEITTLHVGIGWDEMHRLPAIERGWAPYRVTAPMTEPPWLDKSDVLADLRRSGIEPPRLYELGFAHANCGGGCVKAGQGQFVHLLRTMPERFAVWEREEQSLRNHLGKEVSILRDRTGGESTPLTLAELREREASKPEQLDLLDIGGCGCFVDVDDAQ